MNPWDDLITELEDLLEAVKCALETGLWDDLDVGSALPRPEFLPDPSPEERARATALLSEVTSTESELAVAMEKIQSELSQGSTKRLAARHYAGSSRA
ncbi:MAG: hypothetical protein ACC652_09000 [Acidimicrobiales bacterium]